MAVPAPAARLAIALLLLPFTPAAEAQPRTCAERNSVVDRLEKRFGEVRQAVGLNRQNGVIELFASADTGTWTILLTSPDGVSCLIASGDTWQTQILPLRRPEVDA